MDAVGSTRRRVPFLGLALGVAVVAAACGGGDDKSSSTSFPKIATTAFKGDHNKACGLASQSDVESAIGTPVRPGAGAQGVVCRYELASKASSFVLIEANESSQASQIFELKASTEDRAEDLPGVGEKAFVSGDHAVVLRGSKVVTVTVSTGQPPAAVNAALKKLAASVARNA